MDKGLWRSGERPSPEITIGEIIGVWMDFKAKRLDEIIRGNECGSMVSKLCLQQMQPASSLVNKMLLKHCHTHSFQSEIFEIKITEVLQVILKWSLVHD